MPSDFKLVKDLLIQVEGVDYVNDPYDPGGGTKYGITQKEFPNLDIAKLTLPDVLQIYEEHYWNKYRLSEIDVQIVSNLLFLAFINANPIDVAKAMQRAVNASGPVSVEEDGVLGSVTIKAINVSRPCVVAYLRIELIKNYVLRVSKSPVKLRFLRSWLHRTLI